MWWWKEKGTGLKVTSSETGGTVQGSLKVLRIKYIYVRLHPHPRALDRGQEQNY